MKIFRPEGITVLLAAVFLAFCAGWFLRGSGNAQPVRVETARTLRQEEPVVLPAPSPTAGPLSSGEKININTAGVEELTGLPGIGEVWARAIIEDRQVNGPFRIPEDLDRVSGIGAGTLEEILEYITVS